MAARDDHIQIFATVGLSTALINLALLIFGADIANTPASGLRMPLQIGPIRALTGQLAILAVSIVLVVGLQRFLSRTQTGRAIRAVAQNRAAAQLMGIDVNWIYILTFGIGAACVGVAAVLIAPLYPTSPNIGTYFVLTAFVVVVLGGLLIIRRSVPWIARHRPDRQPLGISIRAPICVKLPCSACSSSS